MDESGVATEMTRRYGRMREAVGCVRECPPAIGER